MSAFLNTMSKYLMAKFEETHMGLDATVRCNCFEKGLMKPCPVDANDVYVDEDGYLSSRTINNAFTKMDHERFIERYGKLQDRFAEWSEKGCIHDDGELCSEWVGNWSACAHFNSLVDELGGERMFPLLANLLPTANGGIYPFENAAEALTELDRFIEMVPSVKEWVLCDAESGTKIWTSTDHASFTWMYSRNCKIGMNGQKVFFKEIGKPAIETSHFKQTPIGEPGIYGNQPMKIICLDNGYATHSFDSIGPEDYSKTEREFYVTLEEAPFLDEGKYLMAERIRNLLLASLQTGNPIRWC